MSQLRLFPIIVLIVTLCIVAGVNIVRSSGGSLMQEGLRLNVDWNDPALQTLGLIAAIVIGVAVPLCVTNWLKRRKETRIFSFPDRPPPH